MATDCYVAYDAAQWIEIDTISTTGSVNCNILITLITLRDPRYHG